jgi:hypothetical protein
VLGDGGFAMLRPSKSKSSCSQKQFARRLAATGDVWHIALTGLPGSGVFYGFRVAGEGSWETGYR